MNKILVVVTTLVIGFALCDVDLNSLNLDDVKNQLPAGVDLDSVNITAAKEQAEKKFREKCKAKGHEEVADEILDLKEATIKCAESIVNVTVLTEELDEAKKTGSMDEVFGKYCKKREDMLKCVDEGIEKVKKCLDDDEKESMKMILNTTSTILDFACFKDGDRLALFVAEGGPDCIKEQQEGLQRCANETFASKVPTDLSSFTLPVLVIGEQECRDFDSLQACVVTELEKCKDNTPANIVQAMFKYIRGVTPCKNYSAKSTAPRKFDEKSTTNFALSAKLTTSILLQAVAFLIPRLF